MYIKKNRNTLHTLQNKIEKIFNNGKRLEKLFLMEKERRGKKHDELVFIGIADIAKYYWCAMKSLLKNKEMERAFFYSYLYDRLTYSVELGLIDTLPQKDELLLEIGDQITYNDIEKLLEEKSKKFQNNRRKFGSITTVDKNGKEVIVINPELSEKERTWHENIAKALGYRIAGIEEFPTLRGELFHGTKAELYPTIRWNFEWNGFVILGIPDGITDTFVYEFKTTKNIFFMYYVKPVALTQGDLYGYFFRRNKKRVQICIAETNEIKTWEKPIDESRVLSTLNKFKAMVEGNTILPPKKWKCTSCEFKSTCKIRNS